MCCFSPKFSSDNHFPLSSPCWIRFNAAGCRHHAVTNQTGLTRVSLDFRVVPNRLYQVPGVGLDACNTAVYCLLEALTQM